MNPSRVFTPEGQVSWGGSCMALYNVESPGGYQLTGLTIPGVDVRNLYPYAEQRDINEPLVSWFQKALLPFAALAFRRLRSTHIP